MSTNYQGLRLFSFNVKTPATWRAMGMKLFLWVEHIPIENCRAIRDADYVTTGIGAGTFPHRPYP